MSQLHIFLLVAKNPLRHLYLREHSFGHYLSFMTIAQARNKDQYKNWHPCTVWKLLILTAEQHRTAFALPIHASISLFHILSPPQSTWTSQSTALIDSTFACLSILAKLVTYWNCKQYEVVCKHKWFSRQLPTVTTLVTRVWSNQSIN